MNLKFIQEILSLLQLTNYKLADISLVSVYSGGYWAAVLSHKTHNTAASFLSKYPCTFCKKKIQSLAKCACKTGQSLAGDLSSLEMVYIPQIVRNRKYNFWINQ